MLPVNIQVRKILSSIIGYSEFQIHRENEAKTLGKAEMRYFLQMD